MRTGRPKQDLAKVSIYLRRADAEYLKKLADLLQVSQASIVRDITEGTVAMLYDSFGELDGVQNPELIVRKMMRQSLKKLSNSFDEMDAVIDKINSSEKV